MEISYKPTSVDPLSHLDDGLEGQARKAFIMKVYIILTSKNNTKDSPIHNNSSNVLHLVLRPPIFIIPSIESMDDVDLFCILNTDVNRYIMCSSG